MWVMHSAVVSGEQRPGYLPRGSSDVRPVLGPGGEQSGHFAHWCSGGRSVFALSLGIVSCRAIAGTSPASSQRARPGGPKLQAHAPRAGSLIKPPPSATGSPPVAAMALAAVSARLEFLEVVRLGLPEGLAPRLSRACSLGPGETSAFLPREQRPVSPRGRVCRRRRRPFVCFPTSRRAP